MDMAQMMSGGEFTINATLKLIKDKNVEIISLTTTFDREGPKYKSASSSDGKLQFELERVMKGEKPVLVLKYKELSQINTKKPEILIAEISIKPAINLFWFGNILMLTGLLLAYFKRKKETTN
jgi:hypothetical protein